MLDAVLLALFLPCLGMSAIFIIYMCLLWYATTHRPRNNINAIQPVKPVTDNGLSPSDLQKLPTITGKDLLAAPECAVCLDEIGLDQSVRVIPGCNHSFHLECADTWLSRNPLCPVCRAKLDANFFIASSSLNSC
uniref:E3 ubiquitin-protein ligase ATL23-like n=1 Tax=Cicer arietinum TaxID=3827 RepID=A0A1S2Y6G7_CICAR|nr:E3 ubiquitin-protein ligase ATL23-like [Cicer arietinum]